MLDMDENESALPHQSDLGNQIDKLPLTEPPSNPDQLLIQEFDVLPFDDGGQIRKKRLQKLVKEGDQQFFEVLVVGC